MDKHLRLLRTFVNYRRKKFCNIDTRGQCYKTFYVRNLRIFVISQSVCPWQAVPVQSIVCGQGMSLPQNGVSERFFNRAGSCFTHKHQPKLKRTTMDKHFSLIWTFVNYRRKNFYNIDTRMAAMRKALKLGGKSQTISYSLRVLNE